MEKTEEVEENHKKTKLYNRDSLYEKFKNGKRPEEKDFADLINSTINKLDDGISKSFEGGLELAPQGEKGEDVISLYEKMNDLNPAWKMSLRGESGLKSMVTHGAEKELPAMVINHHNQMGINVETPNHSLEVGGMVAMKGRVGTFEQGEIAADGKWSEILSNLEGLNAFELVAYAHDEKGKGKYAVMYAILLNAYSGKHGRIKRIQNYYSWRWWHRIRLRWVGTPFDYGLQIRTAANYGKEGKLHYQLSKLL